MCEEKYQHRRWRHKLRDALRGLRRGVRGEGNFFVHFFVAAMVLAAAIVFRPSLDQWCLLLLCTAGVLSAEMFNTSIERLAKAVDQRPNPLVGEALDIASAAVLLAAIGAAAVGLVVFLRLLAKYLGWLHS